MNISQAVIDFADLAIKLGAYEVADRIYLQNLILALIGEDDLAENLQPSGNDDSLTLSDFLCAVAKANGQFDEIAANEDIFQAKLMNFLTPTPAHVNRRFKEKYAQSPKAATDYFFDLSKKNDYIKTRAIAKNEHFYSASPYGELEITINLSKPEKDPKQIAAEKMPYSRAILSVCSASKMKAMRAGSIIRHGPIIGLCSLTWLARLGVSNIRPMLILTNIRLFLLKSTAR